MKIFFIISLMILVVFIFPQEVQASDKPCRLWVKGTPHYDVRDPDGNPRNNPDNTLYPGDAFRYDFQWYFSSYCYHRQVHPLQSYGAYHPTGSSGAGILDILIKDANDCHGNSRSISRVGYGGEDEYRSSWGQAKPCGRLSLTISAVEVHCDDGKCRSFTKKRTATITVGVIAPIVEINWKEHILQDPDGYIATNKDYTNYPYDPISIEHIVEFRFKEHRAGTISFDYTRQYKPLVEEGGYECDDTCNEKLLVRDGIENAAGIGYLPYSMISENGGGMYAYTAISNKDAGNHEIRYDVTVVNEGRPINKWYNTTKQLVVLYDPKYEWYDYTVLADGFPTAYDNRHGVVLHYFGSMGSGPDDENKLHETRRSKLNGFHSNTTLYSTGYGILPLSIDDTILQWDSIDYILEENYKPSPTKRRFDGLTVDTDNPLDPTGWKSTDKNHAMFEDSGYGILRFDQKIHDIISSYENKIKWYFLTKIQNNVTSEQWGGYDSFINFNYTYTYPHTAFATWFNMTAYTAEGDIDDIAMSVVSNVVAVSHDEKSIEHSKDRISVIHLDDYLTAKTIHDTKDEYFAVGVVQEAYPMENAVNGTGTLGMWLNKTGLKFYRGFVALEPLGLLELDRYQALDQDTGIQFNMTAGNKKRDIILITEFTHPHHEIVNLHSGNNLTLNRISGKNDTSIVSVETSEYFGEIDTISIGNKTYPFENLCNVVCTIQIDHNSIVVATNFWGGTAAQYITAVQGLDVNDPSILVDNVWQYMLYLGMVSILLYVVVQLILRISKSNQE